MPAALLSPSEMQEIRSAVESGVPIKEVAGHYGVESQMIIKAAQRGKWVTQTARKQALKEYEAKTGVSTTCPPKVPAIAMVTATRAENVERLKDKGISWGLKVLEHAEV